MRNKAILFGSLLMASGAALAGDNLLEAVTKQLAVDAANSAEPEKAKRAAEAQQLLQQAQQLKENVKNTPKAVQEQTLDAAKETARQRLEQAKPEQIKAIEDGAATVQQLKVQVENAPQATEQAAEAAKTKAKQKAAEKVLEFLR
ncbi:hypothetical protein [Methylobacter sp.]|jgi:colicin import membrane protein|uniref:hypothetical protein n=1 Tax=Methylobacter sp. TaxID=2051955 RepID=UPI003DA2CA22